MRFEARYEPLGMWFDVRAFPAEGGLPVYFHDVTARRLPEQRVKESEAQYRLLADMIPQHIWTTGPDGYHSYFSRRWYDFTGTRLEDTEGEGWLQWLHPDDRERTMARRQQSLRTGEPYAIEYRFRGADGRYRWFLGQAMPLRNEHGEVLRWFGTLTDISQRKQLEAEREELLHKERAARAEAEQRRAELERVTESRARLMRGFSHDVRHPLSMADAQAWMLEDGRRLGALADAQRDSVQRIRRAIRSPLRLIDDLLELARTESGELEVKRVETDVAQVVHEVAGDFRAQAAAVGLALEVQAPAGLHAWTDPTRLRQVLSNLLSNAVTYAPEGTVTIAAAPRATGGPRPGPWVALSVADTGPGIAPGRHEAVFQEYTRLAPHAQPGAGIGLAISRRIARLLGGDLTLDSALGRGSTFTL